MDMAAIFTITMVFLTGLTVNHAYPAGQDWPEECKGRSYCHIKPAYYPTETFTKLLEGMKLEFQQSAEIGDRRSETDVADCASRKLYEKLYLILDERGTIRFVAQNDDEFSLTLEIEECRNPGRSTSSSLDENKLQEQRLDCYETKLPLMLPVLSTDGTKLESVAPKGGLPMSCSAKVMVT